MSKALESTAYFTLSDAADLSAAVVSTTRLPLLHDSSEVDRYMVATMVSELGSNIIKYARRGTLRICREETPHTVDIVIWAEDDGPGIADVDMAMTDHFSTGGSLGLGLPGVRRMSDDFWIRSAPGTGTRVYARKRTKGNHARANGAATQGMHTAALLERSQPDSRSLDAAYQTGMSLRACEGQARSGDASLVIPLNEGLLLAMIDGSGHGERAHAIAQRICELLHAEASADLSQLMARLHERLGGTVGAAVGLAYVDIVQKNFHYVGVGNTRAAKLGAQAWRGVSRDGVLGDRLPHLLPQSSSLEPGDLLILWTDGIGEYACPKLAMRHAFKDAAEIAHILVSELGRPYDDACCLVLKWHQ